MLSLVLPVCASYADEPVRSHSELHLSSVTSMMPDATLRIFNRDIVTFRSVLLGESPQQRVKHAESIIKDQLAIPGAQKIEVIDHPQGEIIAINHEAAFVITPEDEEGADTHLLKDKANQVAVALETVVKETHDSRDVGLMLHAGVLALVATLVFVLLVAGLGRVKRLLEFKLVTVTNTHTKRLSMGGVEEHLRKPLVWLVQHAIRLFYWFALVLLAYQWLSMVLAQFPQTQVWGEQLNHFLVDVLLKIGSAVLRALPDLFIACIIFMLARIVTKGLKGLFDSIETGRIKVSWIDADVAATTHRISSVVVWLFAFTMAYPYLPGSGTAAFKGISVLIGLMLSLGASSLVSQAGSGLILTYTRIFRGGEYVAIGEHEGTVVEIGMFTTRIRTGLGVELALPNSLILGGVTKNYSRAVHGLGFVVDTTVTIGYDTPWRQVHAMLVEAATRTSGILSNPAPRVFQTALSDFYPEYRLVCQAIPSEPRPRAEVISALHANIQDVFNQYGVQIMSPHYFADPDETKLVPPSKWYEAPAKEGQES